MKKKMDMMMYVIMGLLEAGKTSLIRDLLVDEVFEEPGKTLILLCEEGEEEYDKRLLESVNAVIEVIDEVESFSGKVIKKFLKKHRPDRIVVEYNGMWPTESIADFYKEMRDICFDREVYMQTIDVVNDETFSLYMKNMSSIMVEQFQMAEMVIVNRCSVEKTNKASIRGSIKSVNPRAQVVYESEDDAFYEIKEELPFDVDAEVITISDMNYGLWYIDLLEDMKKYDGKTLQLTGALKKPNDLEKGFALFGRYAMTCCADDVQYLAMLAKSEEWKDFEEEQYITITARMEIKFMPEYEEEGPVLYVDKVVAAEMPEEEMVYFN